MEDFGARVRQARIKRALTQTELAELARLKRNAVGRIETGERGQSPRASTIRALADALRVRVEWLTVGELPMDRPAGKEATE